MYHVKRLDVMLWDLRKDVHLVQADIGWQEFICRIQSGRNVEAFDLAVWVDAGQIQSPATAMGISQVRWCVDRRRGTGPALALPTRYQLQRLRCGSSVNWEWVWKAGGERQLRIAKSNAEDVA